jgi:hypothetical protein
MLLETRLKLSCRSRSERLVLNSRELSRADLEQSGTQHYFQFKVKVKVKQSCNRPGVSQWVPGGLGSRILWLSAREGDEVVSLTHRPPLPPEISLVLSFTRG